MELRPEKSTREERRQEKSQFGATAHFGVLASSIVHPESLHIADFWMD